MAKLRVTIIDEVRNRRLKVNLPDDAAMEKLLPALAKKLDLPPAAYQLTHEATGRALGGDQTLASFGVGEGDALRLMTEKAVPIWQKLPVWAWGAIGGVVLLIAVAGAFLAGRGAKPKPTPTVIAEVTTPAATSAAMSRLTATPLAPTFTPVPPTATPVPPTDTPVPPTDMPVPPTATPVPPAPPTAPPVGGINCMGAAVGDKVTVLYQWSDTQEQNFDKVLKPLVDACGIVLEPESSRDQALMDTRVKAGTTWDLVIWPTKWPLVEYADKLVTVEEAGANGANYADYWKTSLSVNGKWLALPVKADLKTLIWYSPVVFEVNGYEVPTTWEALDALVEKMVADGNVPWSMGMESGYATGWTGSDFIQDILLVQQGPEYVMDIISGKVPYDHAGVKAAYETYGEWAKDEKYTVGGAEGTVNTSFWDAIYKPFSDPPEAMMVKQSGFAGGEIKEGFPTLQYGTDYDFFPVPGAQGVQGGADYLFVFNASPAAKAVVAYLSSEAGAQEWARLGFDLSPNSKAVGAYTDPTLVKKAEMLVGAAGFTPDLGDTIPAPFGEAEWKAIIDYVNGADLDAVLAEAARVQAKATK
jgi:alpha-glucoside transport system substrate-binding protein